MGSGRYADRIGGFKVTALVNRLKEPSTYAGFAALAIVLGLSAEAYAAGATAAAALFGLIAVFIGETNA